MKICKVYLKNYQQFEDLELDFTDPNTGEPADKICLIGKNGTGKTTLLEFLKDILLDDQHVNSEYYLILKLKAQNVYFYRINQPYKILFKASIDEFDCNWIKELDAAIDATANYSNDKAHTLPDFLKKYKDFIINANIPSEPFFQDITFQNQESTLIIYSPAESIKNEQLEINDVPKGSVNDALRYDREGLPIYNEVSNHQVEIFWKMLIYLMKKRESEFLEYQNLPDNELKTIKQVKEDFDKQHPKILDRIAQLWDRILGKAGLEFDTANASKPIQLHDNLSAYIVLKGSQKRIPYKKLSTGIRNYIFRIGHICSLYFNREIKKAFVFIDEPENSLHPDFLYDLIETYLDVLKDKNGKNNTQLFIATHSPIIAAQFQSYERIILEWQDDATVKARKGTAPIGDDPNDILTQDFELASLMGKEGREMWERYLELKKQLRRTVDLNTKNELAAQISEIGSKYKFEEK